MKKFLAIVLTFILCFGALSLAHAEDTAEVPEGYTPIYTAEDLHNIRNDLAGKYMLMNDIDLSVYENWEPIGTKDEPFTGIFDGNGFKIKSLKIITEINSPGNSYYGLFGYAKNAKFKNICIKDSIINTKSFSSEVTRGYVGNILGYGNDITISNSIVSGTMDVSGFHYSNIGGIVGMVKLGMIDCCSNHTKINVVVDSKGLQVSVGGISGTAASVEKRCSNHEDITISTQNISDNCVVKAGGIDGNGSENMGLLNSYNMGKISIDFLTVESYVGGLSGESYIIENSYNFGRIDCPDEFVGAVGAVSGRINIDMAYINFAPGAENVYYFDNISKPFGQSIDLDSIINVKSLSAKDFTSQASFVGFDFENIWEMEENGYPVLQNEPTFTEPIPNPEPTTESESNTDPEPTTTSALSTTPRPQFLILDFLIAIISKLVNWLTNFFSFVKNLFEL